MQTLEGDTSLSEHLELRHAPGHTPGHQVLRVASEGSRALLSADAFNHPAQLAHPDWPSGSDDDVDDAIATRRAILAELAAHRETVLAPTHFAESFGRVAIRQRLDRVGTRRVVARATHKNETCESISVPGRSVR